ncbi:MAG: hypothetical protein ACIAQZ_04700 [Sedimentisphaeraceae bacterium JB056]
MDFNAGLTDRFSTGCNYWASHAGLFMWSRWDEAIVEADFKLLSEKGLKTLRVFPLWPDFQPLNVLYGEFGAAKEVRRGERRLDSSSPESVACVDPIMVDRFEKMCELAGEYGLELTVMLLTGWMSGRQFKPAPLNDRNIYSNPFALKWQVRFVKYFVERFRSHKCIVGWGLGNESNIMSTCDDPDTAYSWTALISNTIKAADPERPVISGMHGLSVDGSGLGWKISDQGELVDIVTTHPYALFVKHLDGDKLLSIRNTMHIAAESTLYSDLTGKPCMSEELGDLGTNLLDPQSSKTFLNTCLLSGWANNNLGLLWWCAFEQRHLDDAPYDWFAFEQELGIFSADGKPKPTYSAFENFHSFLSSLPPQLRKLPPRKRDAVCLLSRGQDNWAAALSTFVLAKQAGFDVQFVTEENILPDAELYMLPSLCGYGPVSKFMYKQLLDKVEAGASLYISSFDALLPNLSEYAGVKVISRSKWNCEGSIKLDDGTSIRLPDEMTMQQWHREGGFFADASQYSLELEPVGAEVLADDENGNPILTCNKYGKGFVYFLNFGLEVILAKTSFAFENNMDDFFKLYQKISGKALSQRAALKSENQKGLAISEFVINEEVVCVGVNHYCCKIEGKLDLQNDFKLVKSFGGEVKSFGDRCLSYRLDKGKAFVAILS